MPSGFAVGRRPSNPLIPEFLTLPVRNPCCEVLWARIPAEALFEAKNTEGEVSTKRQQHKTTGENSRRKKKEKRAAEESRREEQKNIKEKREEE